MHENFFSRDPNFCPKTKILNPEGFFSLGLKIEIKPANKM